MSLFLLPPCPNSNLIPVLPPLFRKVLLHFLHRPPLLSTVVSTRTHVIGNRAPIPSARATTSRHTYPLFTSAVESRTMTVSGRDAIGMGRKDSRASRRSADICRCATSAPFSYRYRRSTACPHLQDTYRSSAVSVSSMQTEFLRGRHTATAHEEAYPRKSVTLSSCHLPAEFQVHHRTIHLQLPRLREGIRHHWCANDPQADT